MGAVAGADVAPIESSASSCTRIGYVFRQKLAGVEGFEPPNGGIKTRCLTTWRHPNNTRTSRDRRQRRNER